MKLPAAQAMPPALRRTLVRDNLQDIPVDKSWAEILKYSPDQPRDDHGRWTSGGTQTEIGVAASHDTFTTLADVAAAHANMPAHAKLEADLRTGGPGIAALDPHQAAGIWQGSMEPSFVMNFDVTEPGADLRFAAELGTKHDQDAVMLFRHGDGPDTVQRVHFLDDKTAERAIGKMSDFGLDGGTYDMRTHELRIAMSGHEQLDGVRNLASLTGGQMLAEDRGWLMFLGRDEYPQHLAKAAGPTVPYRCTIEIGAPSIALRAHAHAR
jgi:hypothetical protein